jgi:hypothetical protein
MRTKLSIILCFWRYSRNGWNCYKLLFFCIIPFSFNLNEERTIKNKFYKRIDKQTSVRVDALFSYQMKFFFTLMKKTNLQAPCRNWKQLVQVNRVSLFITYLFLCLLNASLRKKEEQKKKFLYKSGYTIFINHVQHRIKELN